MDPDASQQTKQRLRSRQIIEKDLLGSSEQSDTPNACMGVFVDSKCS
jgi:hypothetical protein